MNAITKAIYDEHNKDNILDILYSKYNKTNILDISFDELDIIAYYESKIYEFNFATTIYSSYITPGLFSTKEAYLSMKGSDIDEKFNNILIPLAKSYIFLFIINFGSKYILGGSRYDDVINIDVPLIIDKYYNYDKSCLNRPFVLLLSNTFKLHDRTYKKIVDEVLYYIENNKLPEKSLIDLLHTVKVAYPMKDVILNLKQLNTDELPEKYIVLLDKMFSHVFKE